MKIKHIGNFLNVSRNPDRDINIDEALGQNFFTVINTTYLGK